MCVCVLAVVHGLVLVVAPVHGPVLVVVLVDALVCALVLVSAFVIMVENVFGVHRLVFVVAIVLLLPL